MVSKLLESVVDVQFTRYATILEELEIICCLPGFRRRVLVEYMLDGSCPLEDLGDLVEKKCHNPLL